MATHVFPRVLALCSISPLLVLSDSNNTQHLRSQKAAPWTIPQFDRPDSNEMMSGFIPSASDADDVPQQQTTNINDPNYFISPETSTVPVAGTAQRTTTDAQFERAGDVSDESDKQSNDTNEEDQLRQNNYGNENENDTPQKFTAAKGGCECVIDGAIETTNDKGHDLTDSYFCETKNGGHCNGVGETMARIDNEAAAGGATECATPDPVSCDTCQAMLQAQGESFKQQECSVLVESSWESYLKMSFPQTTESSCVPAMQLSNIQTLHSRYKGWFEQASWPNRESASFADKKLVNAYDCAMIKCCSAFPPGYYPPFHGAICHSNSDSGGNVFTEVECSQTQLTCPEGKKKCPEQGIGSHCDHSCITGQAVYLGSSAIGRQDSLSNTVGLEAAQETVVCCQSSGSAVRRTPTSECLYDREKGQSTVGTLLCSSCLLLLLLMLLLYNNISNVLFIFGLI